MVVNPVMEEQRTNICNSCENKKIFKEQPFCSVCKCFLPLKIKFKTSSCPVNKW